MDMSFFPVIVSVYVLTNASVYPAVVKTLIRLKRLILNCKLKFKLAWVHTTLLDTTADSTIFSAVLPSNPISLSSAYFASYISSLPFPLSFHSLSLESAKPQQTKGSYRIIREKCFRSFYSRHMVEYAHIVNCWKIETKSDQTKPKQISADNILYGGLVARKWFIAWLCCRLKYGKWLSMLNSVDELLTFFPTHILYFCTWSKYTWNCTAKRRTRKGWERRQNLSPKKAFASVYISIPYVHLTFAHSEKNIV